MMVDLSEYIRWLGRFTFDELPLSEADALVMCVISYFDLTAAAGTGDRPVTLADCSDAHAAGRITLQITGGDMGNGEIFRAACASRRFGGLRLEDYENILRTDPPIQFSAVTLSWRDRFSFIAYRGTDETIPGWREDFMISFIETDAQRLAAEYARRAVTSGRKWYIGGHSKGGNLALYAACRLEDQAWDAVERVFILDGPGLCPEVMDTSVIRRIDGKATRIIPKYSVVGRLFEPQITDTRIVRSSQKGILEHSLATWGVEYSELAYAEENDHQSVLLMQILNHWISTLDRDARMTLTADLFDTLSAGGAVTLSDIAGGGRESFAAVLVRMFRTSSITKKVIRELPAQALSTVWKQLLHETGEEEPADQPAASNI